MMNLELWSTNQKKTGKAWIGTSKFAEADKSEEEQIKNQAHGHLLYGQYMNQQHKMCFSKPNG